MDLDGDTFDLELLLPGGGHEYFTLPSSITVDGLKKRIFSSSTWISKQDGPHGSLDVRLPNSGALGVDFAKFIQHKAVYESILKSGLARLELYTKGSDDAEGSSSSSSGKDWMGTSVQRSGWEHAGYTIEKSSNHYPVLLTSSDGTSVVAFCSKGQSVRSFLTDTVKTFQRMAEEIRTQPNPRLFHPANSGVIENDALPEQEKYVKNCIVHDIIPELRLARTSRISAIDVRSRAKSFFFLNNTAVTSSPAAQASMDKGQAGTRTTHTKQSDGGPGTTSDGKEEKDLGASTQEEEDLCAPPLGDIKVNDSAPSTPPKLETSGDGANGVSPSSGGPSSCARLIDEFKASTPSLAEAVAAVVMDDKVREARPIMVVHVDVPGMDEPVEVKCSPDVSVAELKRIVRARAKEAGVYLGLARRYQLHASQDKVSQGTFQAGEDTLVDVFPSVAHHAAIKGPPIRLCLREHQQTKEEKFTSLQVGSLIGRPLCWQEEQEGGIGEVRSFFRHMRSAMACEERPWRPALHAPLGAGPLSSSFPDKFLVRIVLPKGSQGGTMRSTKTLDCTQDTTTSQLCGAVLRKAARGGAAVSSMKPEEWALRICGTQLYITQDVQLSALAHIRGCMKHRKKVLLELVSRTDLVLEDDHSRSAEPMQSARASSGVGREPSYDAKRMSLHHLKRAFEVRVMNVDGLGDVSAALDPAEGDEVDESGTDSASAGGVGTASKSHIGGGAGGGGVGTGPNADGAPGSATPGVEGVNGAGALRVVAGLFHGGENVTFPSTTSVMVLLDRKPPASSPSFTSSRRGIGHSAPSALGPAHNLMDVRAAVVGSRSRVDQWMRAGVPLCDLPRACRLCVTVVLGKKPVGWANLPLFDHTGRLRQGTFTLSLWEGGWANPIGTCTHNQSAGCPTVTLAFPRWPQPVVFPPESPGQLRLMTPSFAQRELSPRMPIPSLEQAQRVEALIRKDPLYRLTHEDKQLLWRYRDYAVGSNISALVKVMASVPPTDRRAVLASHALLDASERLSPADALELLDAKFADARVRSYAVDCLRVLKDDELAAYLLQLVQVLKYEPYHYSELAHFLVERALRNRIVIGHRLFWHLQAEMHEPYISARYGLLLEAYLRRCGDQRGELVHQMDVVRKLKAASDSVKDVALGRRSKALQARLAEIAPSLPDTFSLPLDGTLRACGIRASKCKCMDSAQAPLWIVFENADPLGDPIYVIFKCGDDLRQDLLTLQMLNIMDQLWHRSGLDLHLTPYGCVATGDEMGMIEVVLNSETTAAIQKAAGGVTAAFKQTPLANWLRSHNPSDDGYEWAVENFITSCAGYCVATYVLGIGDRHNDNIMVKRDGHLFHIDFGHFLGNYKTFLKLRREKAPFVLTPEFAYVMGGEKSIKFQYFTQLCCNAYIALREHANVFVNLFAMMLSTGIPELRSEDDIDYLRKAFSLEIEREEDTRAAFKKLIYESLNTKATQLNFAIHILAHRN